MIFVDFGHSVPKMIFIRPPQVQKCPTFPFSCLNQTLNLPSIRQHNTSWVIIGGLCPDVFGQNHWHFHTKYFFNRLKFFYPCMCVCDQFPEQYPSTNHEKRQNLPKSRVGAIPLGFGTGQPATHQPTKKSQEDQFYYPENSDKWIYIDKRGLNQ